MRWERIVHKHWFKILLDRRGWFWSHRFWSNSGRFCALFLGSRLGSWFNFRLNPFKVSFAPFLSCMSCTDMLQSETFISGNTVAARDSQNSSSSGLASGCRIELKIIPSSSLENPKVRGGDDSVGTGSISRLCRCDRFLTHLFLQDCAG